MTTRIIKDKLGYSVQIKSPKVTWNGTKYEWVTLIDGLSKNDARRFRKELTDVYG